MRNGEHDWGAQGSDAKESGSHDDRDRECELLTAAEKSDRTCDVGRQEVVS